MNILNKYIYIYILRTKEDTKKRGSGEIQSTFSTFNPRQGEDEWART